MTLSLPQVEPWDWWAVSRAGAGSQTAGWRGPPTGGLRSIPPSWQHPQPLQVGENAVHSFLINVQCTLGYSDFREMKRAHMNIQETQKTNQIKYVFQIMSYFLQKMLTVNFLTTFVSKYLTIGIKGLCWLLNRWEKREKVAHEKVIDHWSVKSGIFPHFFLCLVKGLAGKLFLGVPFSKYFTDEISS